MRMIKNGEDINYLDWYSPDDTLRELTVGGMDQYFNHFSGEEAGATQIEPGTPVVGYRFMYRAPDGTYKSPFQVNPLTEGLEYAMSKGVSPHLTSQDVDKLKDRWEDMKKQLPEHLTKAYLLNDSAVTISQEGVNVDTEGRGYYYWPDQGIAEDYMKTFFSRGQETTPRKVVIDTTYTPKDIDEHAQIGESMKKVRHPAEYKSHLFGLVQKQVKPAYTETVKTPIYGKQAHSYESSSYLYMQGFTNTRDLSTFIGETTHAHKGPDMSRFKEDPYDITRYMSAQHELVNLDLGSFELHRVSGTAVPNTFGDSGFIMNEMVVDPEPLISVGVNEAYEAAQEYTKRTGQRLLGREF